MAGLPVDNTLTPQSRFITQRDSDPVVEALSSLIAKGVFPKHPAPAPTWLKDGERKAAAEFPKETYEFQVETLKAWRKVMLEDASEIKDMSAEDYEEYFDKYLAPIRDEVKAEIQDRVDPEALDVRGRVKKGYLQQ
jgi:cyclopropane fatty-acyl-phospholipid synthase-like methyltransferase